MGVIINCKQISFLLLVLCMLICILTSCPPPPVGDPPGPPGWAERADSNEGLNCDFYLDDSGRWIPNNDEYCGDFNIKLWYYDNGIKQNLDDANSEGYEDINLNNLKILSPWDWNQEDYIYDIDSDCNIYKNKGAGFTLYATDTEYNEFLLATFDLKSDFEWEGAEDEPYNVTWNTSYFEDGKAIEGYLFKTDGNKNLYFATIWEDEEKRYYYFRIYAHEYGSRQKRPGDDIVLRFACAEVADYAITSQGWPDDTFAVYDKIMLNRLNYFIDERVNRSTGTPVLSQGNDSNYEWLERLGELDWNGREQENYEIYPWTRFRDNNEVWGAVAYSYGCGDSVYDFNADMWELWDVLKYWHSYDEEAQAWNWDDYFFHPVYGTYKEYTIAPNGNWDDYLQGTTNNGITYYPLTMDEYTFYPYVPGFSEERYENYNYPTWYSEWVRYSAGIDCVGFLWRGICYPTNNYYITFIGGYTLDDYSDRATWQSIPYSKPYSSVFRDSTYVWFITENIYGDMREVIVPGDIVAMDGHVAIVRDVVYTEGTREVEDDNIYLIESCTGLLNISLPYCVTNKFRYYDYANNSGINNLQITRLKTFY